MTPGEPVLAGQQALHREPAAEVVTGEHELRRLAGRQHAAMVLGAHASELGQVAAFGQEATDHPAEEVGAHVGHEREQHEHVLVRRQLPTAVQVGELLPVEGVRIEGPRRLPRSVQALAEPVGDQGLEKGESIGELVRVHA